MFQFNIFLLLFMNLVFLSFSLMLVLGFLSVSIISLGSEKVIFLNISFLEIAVVLIATWLQASKKLNVLTIWWFGIMLNRNRNWIRFIILEVEWFLGGHKGIGYVTRVDIFHFDFFDFDSVCAEGAIAVYRFGLLGYGLCFAELPSQMCFAAWSKWDCQAIDATSKCRGTHLLGLHDVG